jgi:hypothetical protein
MEEKVEKENKDEAGCCNPENFKNMFEMMGKCRTGKSGFDCSSMMEAMRSEFCCGSEAEKAASSSDKETKRSCC